MKDVTVQVGGKGGRTTVAEKLRLMGELLGKSQNLKFQQYEANDVIPPDDVNKLNWNLHGLWSEGGSVADNFAVGPIESLKGKYLPLSRTAVVHFLTRYADRLTPDARKVAMQFAKSLSDKAIGKAGAKSQAKLIGK